jgi:hypothetical protein
MNDTTGFVLHCKNYGSVCTHTHHGYSVRIVDLWYTHVKPYMSCFYIHHMRIMAHPKDFLFMILAINSQFPSTPPLAGTKILFMQLYSG